MKIKTGIIDRAEFYIQRCGLHAGRPLREPIPNCFSVINPPPYAYEIIYALYIRKTFYPFIGGSVVPFIRIGDVKDLVKKAISVFDDRHSKNFEAILKLEQHRVKLLEQIKLTEQLRFAYVHKVFKK